MADPDIPIMAHLGELKKRLIRAALFLVVATGLALAFHRVILRFLLAPADRPNTLSTAA